MNEPAEGDRRGRGRRQCVRRRRARAPGSAIASVSAHRGGRETLKRTGGALEQGDRDT